MKQPTPKYTFYKSTNRQDLVIITGKEKAIAYARKFIEKDGNHVLMNIVEDGRKIKMQWMEWIDERPTVITKTMSIANSGDFDKYEKWLKKQAEKAEADKLATIRAKAKADNAKLLAELKAERIAKEKATLAIVWTD